MMAEEKEAKAAKKAAKKEKKEIPRIPGEGDPFGEIATAYSIANRDGGSAFQPRGISDATVTLGNDYIENDDEPWHHTCKATFVGTAEALTCARDASKTLPPLC